MKLIISICEKQNKFIMDVCCRKCNFYWNMKLLSDLAMKKSNDAEGNWF